MSALVCTEQKELEINTDAVSEAGDLLVNYLAQMGVDYVFGVPGGAIEPLYNALARSARREGGPRAIVARHETGAAFMAEGYTRETGKLGVCCATTGPGTTNLMTGVASAYQDNIPMLVITAQTPINTFGKGAIQDSSCVGVNTVGMFQYITRYSSLVSHVAQLEQKIIRAITAAFQAPRGPVHLSIPLDILRSPLTHSQPASNLKKLLTPAALVDYSCMKQLIAYISAARALVFLVGEGCGEAIDDILEFAVLNNATVITTPHGKGLVSSYHPSYRGVFGFSGHTTSDEVLRNAHVDLVLAIGTSLDEFGTNGWDTRALLNDRLIHIDAIESNFARSSMAKLHVSGNIAAIFKKLLDEYRHDNERHTKISDIAAVEIERHGRGTRGVGDKPANTNAPFVPHVVVGSEPDRDQTETGRQLPIRHFVLVDEDKYRGDSTPIKPQRLMYDLARLFPPYTRFLADTGNTLLWTIHYLHPVDRRISGQRMPVGGMFRINMGLASMGWAIGAAVGTALGCPGMPVVCITGDGSFLMSGQEITTAIMEKLPIVYVILNDAALGTVKHGQHLAKAEKIGFELPDVDFAMMARAMGANAHVIKSPQDMADLDINALCKYPGPTVLDVRIDREEVPPLGMRMRSLGTVK